MSMEQGQMQPDTQSGILFCQVHGLVEAGFIDHQAGAGQDTFEVRPDNGVVDGMGEAEVIGIDDEAAPVRIGHSWARWNR